MMQRWGQVTKQPALVRRFQRRGTARAARCKSTASTCPRRGQAYILALVRGTRAARGKRRRRRKSVSQFRRLAPRLTRAVPGRTRARLACAVSAGLSVASIQAGDSYLGALAWSREPWPTRRAGRHGPAHPRAGHAHHGTAHPQGAGGRRGQRAAERRAPDRAHGRQPGDQPGPARPRPRPQHRLRPPGSGPRRGLPHVVVDRVSRATCTTSPATAPDWPASIWAGPR